MRTQMFSYKSGISILCPSFLRLITFRGHATDIWVSYLRGGSKSLVINIRSWKPKQSPQWSSDYWPQNNSCGFTWGTHLESRFSSPAHWGNSMISLGNLYLRYSRPSGEMPIFGNHCLHMSHHHFWFTHRKLSFHCIAQVPGNRKFSNKQTKLGLMADWLAWYNLCKPFQNTEN